MVMGPVVTRGFGFCGLIQRTAKFSRLLRQARDTEDSGPTCLDSHGGGGTMRGHCHEQYVEIKVNKHDQRSHLHVTLLHLQSIRDRNQVSSSIPCMRAEMTSNSI